MKLNTKISSIALLITYLLVPNTLQAGQREVIIRNIIAASGNIMIAVTPEAGAADFPEETAAIVKFQIAAKPGEMRHKFELPAGRYAIAVFHDIDSNGRLKTGIFGIPLEPVGFSKDPNWYFGPPKFGQAAFDVTAGDFQLTVTLSEPTDE